MKKTLTKQATLTIAALAFLAGPAVALADTVAVTSHTSFASPSGGSIRSANGYAFVGTNTITFQVAGKTCNLNGSARGSVPMGCNYAIEVAPDGTISGKLTAGNSVCTQSSDIASACASARSFEIATWYDTWNPTGLNNLVQQRVPLDYATRYNLAFGQFVSTPAGYTLEMTGRYAEQVRAQIAAQAPGAVIYAGLGDTGLAATVADNRQNNNRSTALIVAWLKNNGYQGISIDAEGGGMPAVAELVTQLGASFKAAGLGIAVSAPWPSSGPTALYGPNAVQAFNDNVDAIELQDYSSSGTPSDVPPWTNAGIKASLLMGGASTENGPYQTSLSDTQAWTQYALSNGLRGMFSWRLDNDHGTQGKEEDVDPTFTGAKAIYDTVASRRP